MDGMVFDLKWPPNTVEDMRLDQMVFWWNRACAHSRKRG